VNYLEHPISGGSIMVYSWRMNNTNRTARSAAGTPFKGGWLLQITYPVIIGSIVLLAGCTTPRESHRVSSPPPPAPTQSATSARAPAPAGENIQYVTTSTALPGTNVIVVKQQPPAPPVEAVVAQPSRDHVWMPGYWTWRNERYEWMAGRWQIPPHVGAQWINPRWKKDGNAFRFYEGYWK
jgi:hypothetical protein